MALCWVGKRGEGYEFGGKGGEGEDGRLSAGGERGEGKHELLRAGGVGLEEEGVWERDVIYTCLFLRVRVSILCTYVLLVYSVITTVSMCVYKEGRVCGSKYIKSKHFLGGN